MTGRKTIMVDESVWEKIDSFKYMIRARSIGDAIDEAIDKSISRTYYAGIHQDGNNNHFIEAVGRTEKEVIENLVENNDIYFGYSLMDMDIKDESKTRDGQDCHFIVKCTRSLYYEYLLFTRPGRYHDLIRCSCHLKGKKGERIADVITFPDPEIDQTYAYALLNIENKKVEIVGYSELQMQTSFICGAYEDILKYNPGNFKMMKCTRRYCAEFLLNSDQSDPSTSYVPHRIIKENDEEIIDSTPEGKYYVVISLPYDADDEDEKPIIRGVGISASDAKRNFLNKLPEDLVALTSETNNFSNWEVNESQTEWKHANDYEGDLLILECTKDLYAFVIMSDWYEKSKYDYSDEDKSFELITCNLETIDGVRIAC